MKFNFYYAKDKETFADITEALVKIPQNVNGSLVKSNMSFLHEQSQCGYQ